MQRKLSGTEPHLRILLLESDERDAEMVSRALQSNGHHTEIQHVGTTSAFTSALASFAPDVVIAGNTPGITSRQALQLSRDKHPEVPVVLMVADAPDRNVVESLRAGAADFISKQELGGLFQAIDTALEQRAPLRKLSRRQREVFRLLASGVTMRDIAGQLGLSRKTVETHRAQVMARLGARHVPELVRMAIRLGIVSTDDPVATEPHNE